MRLRHGVCVLVPGHDVLESQRRCAHGQTHTGQGGVLGLGVPRDEVGLSVSHESAGRLASVCYCANRMGVRPIPDVA